MQESLRKLNAWETLKELNIIQKHEFLTYQTAEGLRVTLTSMLHLTDYLVSEEFKFDKVITGNINQDPLEVRLFYNSKIVQNNNCFNLCIFPKYLYYTTSETEILDN